MLVVPIGGLVWAAVGHGGSASTDETIEAEDGGDEEADDTTTTTSKSGKKKKSKSSKSKSKKGTTTSRAGARKATHDAAPCCEALRAAGNEDPEISNRPTYLAAASACESAWSATDAPTGSTNAAFVGKLESVSGTLIAPGACPAANRSV